MAGLVESGRLSVQARDSRRDRQNREAGTRLITDLVFKLYRVATGCYLETYSYPRGLPGTFDSRINAFELLPFGIMG